MDIVKVWEGVFVATGGAPQPGDDWVNAEVLERQDNGSIYASRLTGGGPLTIAPGYWRELDSSTTTKHG